MKFPGIYSHHAYFDDGLSVYNQRLVRYTYSDITRLTQRLRAYFSGEVLVDGLGGDISHWNPSADWEKVAEQLRFMYIRALFGLTVDSKFTQHWQGSKGKVKRGAYLYYLDNLDPLAQAQKLYDTCLAAGNLGELPPTLDIEGISNPTLTASKIKACAERVTQLFGVKPVIYTGFYVWRDQVTGDKAWASAYHLWIAAYPLTGWEADYPTKVLNYPPLTPAPWTMFSLWQWTSSAPGNLYGVSSNYLDLDYASPEFAALYLGGKPLPPPGANDMTQEVQCVTLGAYLNVRANHTANAVDSGNFYKGGKAKAFPEFTYVKKPDLPNKEIWLLVTLADGTAGWVAQWHPTIKNAAGQQYEAVIVTAPPVITLQAQAGVAFPLHWYKDTNAQGKPIMALPPVDKRPKFAAGATVIVGETLITADGGDKYYLVFNGQTTTPPTYVPPEPYHGWYAPASALIFP